MTVCDVFAMCRIMRGGKDKADNNTYELCQQLAATRRRPRRYHAPRACQCWPPPRYSDSNRTINLFVSICNGYLF